MAYYPANRRLRRRRMGCGVSRSKNCTDCALKQTGMVAVSVHFDLAFTFDAHSVVSSSCGVTIPHTVVYHKRNPSNPKLFRYSVQDQSPCIEFFSSRYDSRPRHRNRICRILYALCIDPIIQKLSRPDTTPKLANMIASPRKSIYRLESHVLLFLTA